MGKLFSSFVLLRYHHTEYSQPKSRMVPHEHAHIELYYVIDREVEVTYTAAENKETRTITLHPHEFCVIRPFTQHEIQSDYPDLKVFNLELGAADISLTANEALKRSEYINAFPEAVKLLDEWKDVIAFIDNRNVANALLKFKKYTPDDDSLMSAARFELDIKKLFLEVIGCNSLTYAAKVPNVNIYAKKASNYLIANHNRDIQVREVAGHVGVTTVYLQRIFREAFGMTVKKYLDNIRVEQARNLLADTNFSPQDIAGIVGFGSARTFAATFKQFTGLSPSQYRYSMAHDSTMYHAYRPTDKIKMLPYGSLGTKLRRKNPPDSENKDENNN